MKFTYLMAPALMLAFALSSCSHKHTPPSVSGIINSYAAVLDLDPCEGVSVDNTEGFHPDQLVLVVQMQGARIEGENDRTYGNVLHSGGAGTTEYARISHIERNRIYFKSRLLNRYNTSGGVQLVTVPEYRDLIVKGPVRAARWDGHKGGIVALHVSGNLVLRADIDASRSGFRGGQTIEQTQLVRHYAGDFVGTDRQALGAKGEGIAGFGIRDMILGRGAPANGGGGGGNHNAGGGGGAHVGAGGTGGSAYAHSRYSGDRTIARGLGGHMLQSHGGVLLAGGGGGAGHSNNQTGSDGAAGGGIVVIKAGTIVGEGGAIKVQGGDSETAPYDGAGGAGAGGMVLLIVEEYEGHLRIDASGGKGGNTANDVEQAHVGAGGGGGGGLIAATTSRDRDALPFGHSAAGGKGGVTIRGTSDGTSDGAEGLVVPAFRIVMGREECDRILTGPERDDEGASIKYQ